MSTIEFEAQSLERNYTRHLLLGDLHRPRVPVEDLAADVAASHGLTVDAMLQKGPGSHERHRQLARVDLYRMLRARGMSYPAIGRACGHRHHTTIMTALMPSAERIEAKLAAAARAS